MQIHKLCIDHSQPVRSSGHCMDVLGKDRVDSCTVLADDSGLMEAIKQHINPLEICVLWRDEGRTSFP